MAEIFDTGLKALAVKAHSVPNFQYPSRCFFAVHPPSLLILNIYSYGDYCYFWMMISRTQPPTSKTKNNCPLISQAYHTLQLALTSSNKLYQKDKKELKPCSINGMPLTISATQDESFQSIEKLEAMHALSLDDVDQIRVELCSYSHHTQHRLCGSGLCSEWSNQPVL
ncbi:hypothetical protein V6N12_036617 [Hibiscus sabdariffa]|uniref:Uncharacterized protein n=1 Tax=Hibiscus sabdariffa TaxID=183260 RepID=A0ABR2ER61_9ROSI